MRYIIYYFLPIFLSAHPHIFIDIHLNIFEKNKEFKKIQVQWVFDDMNSEILILDYDLNRDRKFSANETQLFKDEVFNILTAQYHSYTYLKLNSKDINISKRIADFTLSIRGNQFFQLSYTIDLSRFKDIDYFELSFYDESYMTSMILKEKYVKGLKNIMLVEDDNFYGYKLIGWF